MVEFLHAVVSAVTLVATEAVGRTAVVRVLLTSTTCKCAANFGLISAKWAASVLGVVVVVWTLLHVVVLGIHVADHCLEAVEVEVHHAMTLAQLSRVVEVCLRFPGLPIRLRLLSESCLVVVVRRLLIFRLCLRVR